MEKQKNPGPLDHLEPRLGLVLGKIGETLDKAILELRQDLQSELEKVRELVRTSSGSSDGAKALLSVNELCRRAGISRSQVYRWLADPKCRLFEEGVVIRLPGGGRRGRLRFRWTAFEAWLRNR